MLVIRDNDEEQERTAMSECRDLYVRAMLLLVTLALLILMAVGAFVVTDELRDLQRRVGQLEQRR